MITFALLMANTWFQFKQFRIEQSKCAMKVCTDACILGAWFARKVPNYATILDIGAGTGLQMLMLAQQTKARIHGIEIDLDAFRQLKDNVDHSPWKSSITIFPGDVRRYQFPHSYDFIISNPPFFEGDLVSGNAGKDAAKHSTTLSLQQLLETIDQWLSDSGSFGLLIPFHRLQEVKEIAVPLGFHLHETLLVQQTTTHNWFRAIVQFSRTPDPSPTEHTLSIKVDGDYTPEFRELLKDYYLAF